MHLMDKKPDVKSIMTNTGYYGDLEVAANPAASDFREFAGRCRYKVILMG